ncbi:hypothetical protein [Tengunoibacter tsumagoiensis]|uniref:S1 motif domain-containing protein n=1 Tax=Tengunoibacter tsumagoiensis TaxID=2014871 RepID=A0A401ZUI8_9CHLR|nr:hypothetical protein [Tengunoibacter tsumagoiensis]GCE10497.1 hypothetical protein KTT_03560 [Tengunoibacter tsumagoiensis]
MRTMLHPGDIRVGRIYSMSKQQIYVDLNGALGVLTSEEAMKGHSQEIQRYISHPWDLFHRGQEIVVRIKMIDDDKRIILGFMDAH